MIYKLRYVLFIIGLLLAAPLAFMIADLWVAFWTNSDVINTKYTNIQQSFAFMSASISIPFLFAITSKRKQNEQL